MTTARQIITSALTYRLNRLSPGETLDADLAAMCLSALNEIADDMSGAGTLLWRVQLSSATVSGVTATMGTTWADVEPGQEIEGVTYNNGGGDFPVNQLSMEQYHEQVRIKSLAGGLPRFWAYDGQSTVYFYPACTGQTLTIRVRASAPTFADLDTDYVMPQGYQSAFAAFLAELVAPALLGGVTPAIEKAANAARRRIAAQVMEPSIVSGGAPAGNILTGWR